MRTPSFGRTLRNIERRTRHFRAQNEKLPKSGIVEHKLPGGGFERRYYGKDVAAAKDELKHAAWESMNEQAQVPQVTVRMAGSQERNVLPLEAVERYERAGRLAAVCTVRVSGVPWGGTRRGCDHCGRTAGGLRYLPGAGWLCKARCLGRMA